MEDEMNKIRKEMDDLFSMLSKLNEEKKRK